MSGFDLSELLPFYLDETDEHIAALNDALLRLEQDPADAPALAEAFRMFHSIKGASVVMGFEPGEPLTHNLESLFDQFRVQEADARPAGARPDLSMPRRASRLPPRPPGRGAERGGPLGADHAGHRRPRDRNRAAPPPAPAPAPSPPPAAVAERAGSRTKAPAAFAAPEVSAVIFEGPERVGVTVVFEPNLPLPDMKARLVLNRLAAQGRVLETHPPADQLDEVESLHEFTVFLAAECDPEELRALADVDGVARIRIEHGATNRPGTPSAEPALEPGPSRHPSPSRTRLAGAVIEATRTRPSPRPRPRRLPVRRGHRHPEPRRRAPAALARPRWPRRSGSRATGSIT